jgi:hypothetical protein
MRGKNMATTYMLDTTVFNNVLDDVITLPVGLHVVATHVQHDELANTRKQGRRDQLLATFARVAPARVPTKSALWNASRWDEGEWSDGKRYRAMLAALDAKNGGKDNNKRDVLIAETALEHGYVLVTGDVDLRDVFGAFGGNAIPPQEIPGIGVGGG